MTGYEKSRHWIWIPSQEKKNKNERDKRRRKAAAMAETAAGESEGEGSKARWVEIGQGEAYLQLQWLEYTDVISLIGRRYSDPSVRNDKRLWPFKVRASMDGELLVDVLRNGKLSQFTPVYICSMILIKIKETAEKNLGAAVTDAVMTVPVYFSYEQRQAMKQAGLIAGFNILQIISAPAASALFYGMERWSKISNMINNAARSSCISEPQEHKMIIVDLGAGTLDVAAVTIKENVCKVEATAGDIHLGGSDFDNNLIDHFVDLMKKEKRKI